MPSAANGLQETLKRLRSLLSLALPIGAMLATLVAVGIVVALFWWVQSLPTQDSEPAAIPQAPQRRADAAAARRRAENPSGADPATPLVQTPVGAAPTPPTAPPAAARPPRQPNGDAEKNRAIGQALSRMAEDPEMQRKLGSPPR